MGLLGSAFAFNSASAKVNENLVPFPLNKFHFC